MSGYVTEVPAASRQMIRQAAEVVRRIAEQQLGASGPYLPIIEVIEWVLPKLDPQFIFCVAEEEEMGEDHGLTIPSQHLIKLRSDVYERACSGHGRDRSTAAHELGHYILHENVGLPRRMRESELPSYRSSEWQANCFAGELLVCARFVSAADTAFSVARRFGVSMDSAAYQLKVLKREGRI